MGMHWTMHYDLNLKNGGNIINLDKDPNNGGTHWVYAWIASDFVYYFDPIGSQYGGFPIQAITDLGLPVEYNEVTYQPLKSRLCGYYCVYLYRMFDKAQPGSLQQCKKIVVKAFGRDGDVGDVNKIMSSFRKANNNV